MGGIYARIKSTATVVYNKNKNYFNLIHLGKMENIFFIKQVKLDTKKPDPYASYQNFPNQYEKIRLKVVKTDFKQSLFLAYFISSLRYVDAFRISDKLTDFLLPTSPYHDQNFSS